MSLSDILALIQTILSVIGILVSIAIFILGIIIANNSKYREENSFFYEIFKKYNNDFSYFKFKNYKLFIRKLKKIKKAKLYQVSCKFEKCISEDCLLLFLKISKDTGCISWNGNNDSESGIEIIDQKKIVRLTKKINEHLNTR